MIRLYQDILKELKNINYVPKKEELEKIQKILSQLQISEPIFVSR